VRGEEEAKEANEAKEAKEEEKAPLAALGARRKRSSPGLGQEGSTLRFVQRKEEIEERRRRFERANGVERAAR
jgi:hypothetical protein